MSLQPADTSQAVAAAIRDVSHIATLPEITLKIVELVEDQSSTAQDLHKVISHDPALCSRILKVVNSSFYGMPGQVGSINRAIVLLGLNAVKNIAISASLAKLFKGGQLCPGFAARDLWMHSIATAAAAKLLADEIGLSMSDEAFLAGLIHDIGVMVELQHDRNKLIEVVNSLGASKDGVPGADMLEAEQRTFGATHQDFGRALCEKWKFPKSFINVAGSHHAPMGLPAEGRTLCCLVYAADRLAASADVAYRLDLPDLEFDPDVLSAVSISIEQVEQVRQSLPAHVEEVQALLN